MSYTKTNWINDNPPPINQTNLNKIEEGIYRSYTQFGLDASKPAASSTEVILYFATDSGTLYLNNGTSWDTVSVKNHSSQHENGGADELDIKDLDIGGSDAYLSRDGSNLTFTDPVSGTKSLSEIAASGVTESIRTFDYQYSTWNQQFGLQFGFSPYMNRGLLKTIRLRVDFTSGQQLSGSALINEASGVAPADSSAFTYDSAIPSEPFAVDDYVIINGEFMLVTSVNPATQSMGVSRHHKDTSATYHDDNDQIVKANNGARLIVWKESDYLHSEKILEVRNMMTWSGITREPIVSGSNIIRISGSSISNLDADDYIYIDDTTPERAVVQQVTLETANSSYAYSIFTRDPLLGHPSGTKILKEFKIDTVIPYKKSGTQMNLVLHIDEKISSDVDFHIEVESEAFE